MTLVKKASGKSISFLKRKNKKSFKKKISVNDIVRAVNRRNPPDPLEGIDIEKEIKLIRNKMSDLSSEMRRKVQKRYAEMQDDRRKF